MSRALLGILAGLVLVPAAASGQDDYFDPADFGVQGQAKLDQAGKFTVRHVQLNWIPETSEREEVVTRTIEVNGQKQTEQFTRKVPSTAYAQLARPIETQLDAKVVQAFDMEGKPIAAGTLAAALARETTVLLATRKLPGYYLTVYKPDTLLLVIEPEQWYGIGGEFGGFDPAANPPALAPPAPAPAPALAPAPAPAEENDAPAAAPAQNVPVSPVASLATTQDGKLGLRRFLKEVSTKTATRDVELGGVKKTRSFPIEVEAITDIESKYPLDALHIYRADGKPVTAAEVAQIKGRCVLCAQDGKVVDPSLLKIVRPDALIVVSPVVAPAEPPGPIVFPAGVPILPLGPMPPCLSGN